MMIAASTITMAAAAATRTTTSLHGRHSRYSGSRSSSSSSSSRSGCHPFFELWRSQKKKKNWSPPTFLFFLLLVVVVSSCCDAKLQLPTFISSHMVLQREPHKAKIWGWASLKSNVTLELLMFNDESSDDSIIINNSGDGGQEDNNNIDVEETTTATILYKESIIANDIDGYFEFNILPQPSSTNRVLRFVEYENDNSETSIILLYDIDFGDVYLCSGQSNMEMSIAGVFNSNDEIQDSIHYTHLRLASTIKYASDIPQKDVMSRANYTWLPSSPIAMNIHDSFSYFSATCYFFGRTLYQHFNATLPIGLLVAPWGGQRVSRLLLASRRSYVFVLFCSPILDCLSACTAQVKTNNLFNPCSSSVL